MCDVGQQHWHQMCRCHRSCLGNGYSEAGTFSANVRREHFTAKQRGLRVATRVDHKGEEQEAKRDQDGVCPFGASA